MPEEPTVGQYQIILQMIADRDKLADERLANQQNALLVAIAAQDKQTQQALIAAKEAVIKAETATEKRFEGVNEFRKALADQSNTFMTRVEVEAAFTTMSEKVDGIGQRLADTMNRSESLALHKAAAEKIATNTERIGLVEGRGSGMDKMWGYVIGLIGILVAIYALKR
jgi:hypothetical protein